MEILIYLVLPCAGSAFLLGAMFYGAYRIAGQPSLTRSLLAFMAIYIVVCVAFSTLGSTWVNLAFMLLFPFAAGRIFETPKIHYLYYFILSAAVFLTDTLTTLLLQFLLLYGILSFNSQELAYMLFVVFTRMTEFMVILLVTMAAGHKAGQHITVRQVVLSILLPLYSVFHMYCLVYLMQIYMSEFMVILFGVNLFGLIGLNIYFCVLVDVMSENYRLENERNLYQAQARMQHQYYEREEEKYEASRKLIHDIRNHILAMEGLYGEENAVQAYEYARDIHDMLNQFQQKYYTSEKLLNIILNDKVQAMKLLSVREDIRVGELSLDFMRETDVTALFANLLDNAVAAAAKEGEGYVRFRAAKVRQFISVTVENNCSQEPAKEGGLFRSCRAGHEGLGLKIVQQTAARYGGDVQFEWKEGVFTVKVMLAAP
ncbi:MAG: GHKL domain-containing protein [Lachnospiraceae bacterium]|jgi:two-component system sensor histidine kinase AgrC|nr:GHKL domain-containing protein [Lachnospiraceae bacterium]